jgi:hypothetical protein
MWQQVREMLSSVWLFGESPSETLRRAPDKPRLIAMRPA